MTLPNAKKRKIFDGRYEIIALVGRGAESVVYHARHVNSPSHEVALKVLHSHNNSGQNQNGQTSLTDRLRKEALTLVSCRHKYVVRLDDFHSVQDLCYLSMEYAAQGDLRKYITALGISLSAEQGKMFLRQMLEALDFVHATGVIHRDIKPDNILVVSEREVRLADFGLALLPGDEIDLEELKRGAGSFAYLPPELLEGVRYDTRSDLYSMGLCFYEALAGFHPFEKLPMADQLDARRDDRLPPLSDINPTVPKGLSNTIAKLLRFDPERRFQSAAQALKALADPDFEDTEISPVNGMEDAPGAALGETDNFEIISNPYAENEDMLEVSAQTLVSDALFDEQEPDRGEKSSIEDGEQGSDSKPARERLKTEEFDLERLQNLIDQDTSNKTFAAQRRAQIAEQASQSPEHDLLNPETTDRKNEQFPLPGAMLAKTKSTRSSSGQTIGLKSPIVKMVILAAAATVLSLASLSFFLRSDKNEPQSVQVTEGDPQSVQSENTSDDAAPLPETPQPKVEFPRLPQGLYAGSISNLLPKSTTPLALISMPSRKSLVVIVGIPGWTPVEVALPEAETSKANTITVRSNGLIINVTGELSGESITGMFSNAVTGESGSWSARVVK
jgi:serine/threonine protein kinase